MSVALVSKLAPVCGRVGLRLAKNSPHIFLAGGIACVAGGTILACKATLRVEDELKEHRRKMDLIKEGVEKLDREAYSEEDEAKDRLVAYVQTTVRFIMLYAPSISLLCTGIGLICHSHSILVRRNAALMAAYKTLDEGFKRYREKVKRAIGEEAEQAIYSSPSEVREASDKAEPRVETCGPYSFVFDSNSSEWRRDINHTMMRIKHAELYGNDLLLSRGHVFMNDIYDMLGAKRTAEGSIIGWVAERGQNRIDLGFFIPHTSTPKMGYVDENGACLLEMNCDGIIWDLLDRKENSKRRHRPHEID